MWVKEYVFNALIPVVHIILYSIFVGSAIDFATSNPIYAIVCIGFLIPAEKFIRKMFGFDKATTSGQLGAAAGGAMIMNAVNKIGHKTQKESQENPAKVRTAGGGGYLPGGGYSGGGVGGNPLSGLQSNGQPLGSVTQGGNPVSGQQFNGQPLGPVTQGGNPLSGSQSNGQTLNTNGLGTNPPLTIPLSYSGLSGGSVTTRAQRSVAPKRNIIKGLSGVRKHYFNRNTPKKIGKLARRGLTRAAGAAALRNNRVSCRCCIR